MVSFNGQEKSVGTTAVMSSAKSGDCFPKYLTILTDFLPMRKAVFIRAVFCGQSGSKGAGIAASRRQNGGADLNFFEKKGTITGIIYQLCTGMTSARVVTLGCRLNAAESEVMKTWADEQKVENAIIVNTCAVTNEAERQARQTIRRLRRENPDAYIIVTGCAVQLRPKVFASMPEIDRLLGNDAKADPSNFKPDSESRVLGPMAQTVVDQVPLITPVTGQVKAFIQVQNGCNHFCTFCTIALARGRSRSVPLHLLIPQVQNFLASGVKEIILTGVDLTSYDDEGMTLGGMIGGLLDALPDLRRLRLSSLDSMEVDDDLFQIITEDPRILPHIHLSLQAGSNTILGAMKRRHDREQAITLCQKLKKQRPDIVLGADFITGFPGESEDMFQETIDLVHQCALTHLHVFPFSKRPGTPAARMTNQVAPDVIKDRAARLRLVGQEVLAQFLTEKIGTTVNVLAENASRGHSDDFTDVHFSEPAPPWQMVRARVIGVKGTGVVAHPLE
jgi:threonylcarbamoyladenosine tRNA methylthiotransferase MtaB